MENLKPRIYRTWLPRQGRFGYTVNSVPTGRWGMGIPFQTQRLWDAAHRWCNIMNDPQLRMQAAMIAGNRVLEELPWKPAGGPILYTYEGVDDKLR